MLDHVRKEVTHSISLERKENLKIDNNYLYFWYEG